MKNLRKIVSAICALTAVSAGAQGAFDLYSISQSDLRGTARFMSMAGAFGALGADLSTLNQNPGGIGVYRSSEVGVTMGGVRKNVDMNGFNTGESKFNFDNIAYVGTFRTGNEKAPSFSWGVSFTKAIDFNRHYSGSVDGIRNSMTNYVADRSAGWKTGELGAVEGGYDPYIKSNAPWISILAYNSYMINPNSSTEDSYSGLYKTNTKGYAEMEVQESGYLNEYNVSFGGNAKDKVYWGASVGISDLQYDQYSYYGESLTNALVPYNSGNKTYLADGSAAWGMENYLRMNGAGVNFKAGLIVKPINELRIGFAFHTPTFFNIHSYYYASTSYEYIAARNGVSGIEGTAETNAGYEGESEFDARTPWRVMGSVAGVIGGRCIISLDYERIMYEGMRAMYNGREDRVVTENVKTAFKGSDIIRIGGEFKVTPEFSLRAGYSYQSSPYNSTLGDDVTAGTIMSYTVDNKIQHFTAGMGYRHKAFYADIAYVRTNRQSDYFGFYDSAAPSAAVNDKNNEVAVSIGFKF